MPDRITYRSPADIAEAIAVQQDRITPAEAHGWTVMDSLEDDVKERLYKLLDEVPRD